MDPNVKTLWLKALRSGNYKQGYMKLRSGDRFCCLGVLRHELNIREFDLVYFVHPDIQVRLVGMNDVDKWSFARIADWIETNI